MPIAVTLMSFQSALNTTVATGLDRPALPKGTVIWRSLRPNSGHQYFLYLPKSSDTAGAPVLVSMHGISRNAREHVARLSTLADRYGTVIVAPWFSEHWYGYYQRLGRGRRKLRADLALDRILDDVARLAGARTDRIYLFGYSGGGQFAHRYAMAHPGRVMAAVIAAAGWYTFPDPTRYYPYGIRWTSKFPALQFEPKKFLEVPVHVFVGEFDIERDPGLRVSKRLNQQQGRNRLERGKRWVDAMKAAAERLDFDTSYTFEILPDVDHAFTRAMDRGKLAERIFKYLVTSGLMPIVVRDGPSRA